MSSLKEDRTQERLKRLEELYRTGRVSEKVYNKLKQELEERREDYPRLEEGILVARALANRFGL